MWGVCFHWLPHSKCQWKQGDDVGGNSSYCDNQTHCPQSPNTPLQAEPFQLRISDLSKELRRSLGMPGVSSSATAWSTGAGWEPGLECSRGSGWAGWQCPNQAGWGSSGDQETQAEVRVCGWDWWVEWGWGESHTSADTRLPWAHNPVKPRVVAVDWPQTPTWVKPSGRAQPWSTLPQAPGGLWSQIQCTE